MPRPPDQIANLRHRFLAELRGLAVPKKPPRGLYEPIDYILALGGKRVRPLLALIAARMFGDGEELTLGMPVALAVEVFHNFTLVHDDVMDKSPLRRGQPTVHTRWDVNTAILSGDLMLIQAYTQLSDLASTGRLPDLLRSFNRVAKDVCEGQQYDVDFESRREVSIEEYLKMIELKTAVLLGGALELGALAAGASRHDADHLYAFGRLTGLAFQLQDDLLDTFGTTEQTGKLTGNDIIRNKKTFLYIKAYHGLTPELRAELDDWFQQSPEDPTQKIARVTELMRQGNIPYFVSELRDQLQKEAYAHLDAAGGEAYWKEVLRGLAEGLLERKG